jgi:beta-fructofuranosidase
MSLPRELSLYGSQVQMRPAAEVGHCAASGWGRTRRATVWRFRRRSIQATRRRPDSRLRAAPDGSEQTLVYYDREQRLLAVDRSHSSSDRSADRGMQSGPFLLDRGEPLRLHIFLDGSVIEIFANDRFCLTRAFIRWVRGARGIGLHSSGGTAKMASFEAWEMRPISQDRLTS